jgi:hypothetical protein
MSRGTGRNFRRIYGTNGHLSSRSIRNI